MRLAGRGKNQHGGLTFGIAGDIALRFELRVDTPKDVQRLCVDFEGRATRAGVLVETAGKSTASFTILRAAAVEEKTSG